MNRGKGRVPISVVGSAIKLADRSHQLNAVRAANLLPPDARAQENVRFRRLNLYLRGLGQRKRLLPIILAGVALIGKKRKMTIRDLTGNIEFNIIFFSLLLHTFWEGLHSYFYIFPDGLAAYPRFCWFCVSGDVLIALGTFFLVGLIHKKRKWILDPSKQQVVIFVLSGVVFTIISEFVHVNTKGTWQYSELMPLIPLIDVGISPLVQWIVIPLALIFIIRRQLNSHTLL